MNVVRERPSQRLHHRVAAPLYVEMENYTYRVTDWSLGGFRIDGYRDDLPALEDEIPCSISLPFQGFNVSFDAMVKIVRSDAGEDIVATTFTVLGDREKGILTHFVDELVRGVMVPLEDTIQRIDTPVTPVATTPDPNPTESIPVNRLPIKTIITTIVYFGLGLVVLAYAGLMIFGNFFRIEIETAVLSSPVQVVAAPEAAQVASVDVQNGALVEKGQTLISLISPDLQKDIDEAELKIRDREFELIRAQGMLDAEKEKLEIYEVISRRNIEKLNTEISSLERAYAAAKTDEQRKRELLDEGWSTSKDVDRAAVDAAMLASQLETARSERDQAQLLLNKYGGVNYFDGNELVSNLTSLEVAKEYAVNNVELAKAKKASLVAYKDSLSIRAPFAGRVKDVSAIEGMSVLSRDTLLTVEQRSVREVQAFLSQDDVLDVIHNSGASIYVPALDRNFKARVSRVDRTSGFIDEMRSKYTWRGKADPSAVVTLEIADAEFKSDRLRPGLPAVVILERNWKRPIKSALAASGEL